MSARSSSAPKVRCHCASGTCSDKGPNGGRVSVRTRLDHLNKDRALAAAHGSAASLHLRQAIRKNERAIERLEQQEQQARQEEQRQSAQHLQHAREDPDQHHVEQQFQSQLEHEADGAAFSASIEEHNFPIPPSPTLTSASVESSAVAGAPSVLASLFPDGPQEWEEDDTDAPILPFLAGEDGSDDDIDDDELDQVFAPDHPDEEDGDDDIFEDDDIDVPPCLLDSRPPASFDPSRKLRRRLVGTYRPGLKPNFPPHSGAGAVRLQSLSKIDLRSLQTYYAWATTGGSLQNFSAFARVLSAENLDVYSPTQIATLVTTITELQPVRTPMCPNSCIAFDGDYADVDVCPKRRRDKSGKVVECGGQRLKAGTDKPTRTFITLPILPRMRAIFGHAPSSQQQRYRDRCLQEALKLAGTATHRLRDYADGQVHTYLHQQMDLFQDARDAAFMLSTDGAQLVLQRQSDLWLVLLTLINFPPEIRLHKKNVMIVAVVPGPNQPIDLESFLWPLFTELARASEGFWLWDAIDSSWFLWRAHVVAVLTDMLGAPKLSKTSGHQGNRGCHTCLMHGQKGLKGMAKDEDADDVARDDAEMAGEEDDASSQPAKSKGSKKTSYFPLLTVAFEDDQGPESRRHSYDPLNLPLRDEDIWRKAMWALQSASTSKKNRIRKQSGYAGLPVLSFSRAHVHPTFHPPDIFHLFFSNIPVLIYNILISPAEDDPVKLSLAQRKRFGELVAGAAKDLPACFAATAPRDPHLKMKTQYKMHEWACVLLYYLLPYLVSIDADPDFIDMLGHLIEGIQVVMNPVGATTNETAAAAHHFKTFCTEWERILIRDDIDLLHRARMCIHQLLHITTFQLWIGPLRGASQACCEREIGYAKRSIRSHKESYRNLENQIIQRENLNVLEILLGSRLTLVAEREPTPAGTLHGPASGDIVAEYQDAESDLLTLAGLTSTDIVRHGKLVLADDVVLRSLASEGPKARRARRFRYKCDGQDAYAEAIYFLYTPAPVVMAMQYADVQSRLGATRAKRSNTLTLLPVAEILELVGVYELDGWEYFLRHHQYMQDLNA